MMGDTQNAPRLSVVIPTRNRCMRLAETLRRLHALPDRSFEIIVVDNASTDQTKTLAKQFPGVDWCFEARNHGAAARNLGVQRARGEVILMLDDDSWPEPGVIDRLITAFDCDANLGAVVCRVLLADDPSRHDAGGAAGVIVNCGAAVRRSAFLETGGYPSSFDYYVEEYDLCCKLLHAGWHIDMAGDLVIYHQRTQQNRDPAAMIYRLVRNNIELWSRYAPAGRRNVLVDMDVERYRRIAKHLNATDAFHRGLRDGVERAANVDDDIALTDAQFDKLFRLDRARQLLRNWADKHRIETIAIWSRGKGCELLIEAAFCAGVRPIAVYDSQLAEEENVATHRWRGIPLHDASNVCQIEAHGVLLGTLSLGVAANFERDLRNAMWSRPIFNPVPWSNLCDDAPVARQAPASDKLASTVRPGSGAVKHTTA